MSEASPPQMGGSRVSVGVPGQMNLYSGTVLVLLGLIALAISFFHPGPVGDYVQPEAFEPSPVSSAERATKDDAVAMVKKAVAAIKASVDKVAPDRAAIDKAAADKTAIDKAAADKAAADKAAIDKTAIDKAYADITAKGGPFTDRDIYIVVYKTDGVVLAHAQNERLVGTNQKEAKDPDENAFVAKRIELAKKNQPFWHYYKFVDPLTQKTERNQMYCEPLNDTIVCGDVGAVAPGLRSHFLSIFLFVTGNFGPVLWPRMFALLIILAGAGMAAGQLNIRNKQDFFGGLALIGLAVVAMLASVDLPGMRGFAFGPGTAPRMFADLLAVLGLVVSVTGVLYDGPEGQRYTLPGFLLVGGSLVLWLLLSGMIGVATQSIAMYFAHVVTALVLFGLVMVGPNNVVERCGLRVLLERYGIQGRYVVPLSILAFAPVLFLISWVFGFVVQYFVEQYFAQVIANHVQVSATQAQVIATAVLIAAAMAGFDVLERVGVRGPFLITLSIFTFAIFIRPLGLVLASFLSVMVCAGAAPDNRWRETVLWAEVLTAFCSVLFPYGLNLPFQLWPPWWQQEFWLRPLWVAIAIMIATVIYFVRTHERTDGGERHV